MSDQKERSDKNQATDFVSGAAERDGNVPRRGEEDDGAGAEGVGTQAGQVPEAEEIIRLNRVVEDAQDLVLRTQAEMQNLRRRVERDMENAHKFGQERLVGELLPVVDNLERSMAAFAADDTPLKAVEEGVELTLKSMLDVLERQQVEQLNPVGEVFNPEFHQAMSMVPSASVAPNTILEVYQKGYTLNGRLVRPAMVVVARSDKQEK